MSEHRPKPLAVPDRHRRVIPLHPDAGIPQELARRVRLVILDVDGVLTDNGVYIGQTASGDQVEMKRFHIQDGLGIKLLRMAGIGVALISGRSSPATLIRARELGVECYQDEQGHKLDAAERVVASHGVEWEAVAALCDDLADLPILDRVGLPVAVANAVREVEERAIWRTARSGGDGAVREFIDALLLARGELDIRVAEYRREREVGDAR